MTKIRGAATIWACEGYGFTDEESDFIRNYDIKYRMGGDDSEKVE